MPLLVLCCACNPARKLKEHEYLLEKNIILDKYTGLDKAEIETFIRQKPNRKIAKLVEFHLWLYNQVDQGKMKRVKVRRNEKYERYNAKAQERTNAKNKKIDKENERIKVENRIRKEKGKRLKKLRKLKKPRLKDKEKLSWRESLLEIGEAPTILDTFLTKVSRDQMQKYLITKGYFKSTVRDSTVLVEFKRRLFFKYHKKRAYVYYKISPSKPYTIRHLGYKIADEQLAYHILQDSINGLIKPNMRYDADMLQGERERIVKTQKNNGYYDFAQDYIYYLVDTNLRSNQMDITLCIKKFAYKPGDNPDTVLYRNHTRYYIHNIYVVPHYLPGQKNLPYSDSIVYNDVIFLSNGPLKYRRTDLFSKIMFGKGQLYHYGLSEETYNKFADLRAFKNISIQYRQNSESPEKLDCFIYLSPILKQNFVVEWEGTNTSGNLGVAGNIVYQNRNTLKGAELLELKLRGGLTAQKNLTGNDEPVKTTNLNFLDAFNTFQFGPELNFYIPKQLFPFSLFSFSKNASPKTIFTSSLNYQKRPEFSRTLTNVSYGFQFKSGDHVRQNIVPFEFNIISADLSNGFKEQLDQSHDFFLKNSFADHVTTVSRYSLTYNDQIGSQQNRRILTYFKTNIESSGNILRGLFDLADKPQDDLGRYHILKVPFAQFLRIDLDLRVYKNIRQHSRLVFRAAGGVGKPLYNLRVLPYEKSFFGGGPNSIRAWKSRALGPGSYAQPDTGNVNFDKLGDAQLEFNLEYRFNLYKFLNGAWFIDAGNIWLRKPDPLKPGGDFKLLNFYKEIATGSGFGLRADFSFFIIRLDAAFKLYNPALPEGDRWMLNKKPLRTTIFNFGIGYPF